jgi:maltodextrin utilization protein YvdJ
MARRYERLTDEVCGKRACRAFFGCGNGGRDFDELDPTEAYHALTESERNELRFGASPLEITSEDGKPLRGILSPAQKKAKKKRKKSNKKENEARWRKENQAKW